MTRDDDDDEDHIHMRPLLRIGAWGVCALMALGTVVLAGRSEVGEQRLGDALAALTSPGTRPPKVAAVQPAAPDSEAARLAETVRALVADRDRLSARVATLEHNLSEITGSVAHDPAAGRSGGAAPATASPGPDEKTDAAAPGPVAAVTPLPPQSSMPSAGETPPSSAQPTVGMTVNVPLPRPAPLAQIQSYVTSATRTTPPPEPESRVAEAPAKADADPAPETAPREFAIDLAAATNVNALRARWGTIKGTHPALLDGLRPLVSVRESTRPGFTEFHLVAGPLADAAIAERLCAVLTAARSACKVAVFDGQRLDLR
jgi:hypothetical protein